MRNTFIETLCELAVSDEGIWLVSGDLGFSVVERFADRFPDRFLNAGVSEQNMTGVAAGLAMAGNTVFTYSIANFATLRCLEQIRNDVCYHRLSVVVVAVGGGVAYGSAGYSHHAVEDLGVMRVLPHMTVVAPGDPIEARLATIALAGLRAPAYLRLGKGGEPRIHASEPPFRIGRAIVLSDEGDVTLVSTGTALPLAVRAAEELRRQGQAVRVISMPSIAPLDETAIVEASAKSRVIVTIEDHGMGGLASVVAEVLAARVPRCLHRAVRLSREPGSTTGDPEHLRSAMGLSVQAVIDAAT